MALLQLELRAGEPLGHLFKHTPPDQLLPMARYDRGVTVLMLMTWPAAAGLLRRRHALIAVIVAALTLVTLLEFVSQAAALAALVGLVVLPWGWLTPRVVAAGCIALVLGMGLVFPPLAPDGRRIADIHQAVPQIKISGIHRLAIWHFAAEHIAERPFLGWGMDAARALPGGKTPVSVIMPEVELPPTSEILPLHPHDAALQWRLELGVPGFLLAAAIVSWLLLRIAATPVAWYRALSLGYAAAVLTVALLSYGAWQEWWLCSLWLSAAALAALKPRPT
jgi:O-antigen ligase